MHELKNRSLVEKLPVSFNAWKLLSNDTMELIELELGAGEVIEKHINPVDVSFYILEGSGTLTIDDKAFKLQQYDCISVEKGLEREWNNTGGASLRALVIKQL